MSNDAAELPAPSAGPDWGREVDAYFAAKEARRVEVGLPFESAPMGRVPIHRLLEFAKAVRAQPEVWERCVVEAERRKHEVADPDSEIRRNEEVFENTNPENFLLSWGLFVHFAKWFMINHGFIETDNRSTYLSVQFLLRMWNRGEVDESDDVSFIKWYKDHDWAGVDFDDEVKS